MQFEVVQSILPISFLLPHSDVSIDQPSTTRCPADVWDYNFHRWEAEAVGGYRPKHLEGTTLVMASTDHASNFLLVQE